MPDFCNSRQLRDYQQESLAWMVSNWWNEVNCILGDEVGRAGYPSLPAAGLPCPRLPPSPHLPTRSPACRRHSDDPCPAIHSQPLNALARPDITPLRITHVLRFVQMGLGKTAQSIAVLAYQKQFGGKRGPFMGGWVWVGVGVRIGRGGRVSRCVATGGGLQAVAACRWAGPGDLLHAVAPCLSARRARFAAPCPYFPGTRRAALAPRTPHPTPRTLWQ